MFYWFVSYDNDNELYCLWLFTLGRMYIWFAGKCVNERDILFQQLVTILGMVKWQKVTGLSLPSIPVYGRAMIEIKCSNGRTQTMGKWTDVWCLHVIGYGRENRSDDSGYQNLPTIMHHRIQMVCQICHNSGCPYGLLKMSQINSLAKPPGMKQLICWTTMIILNANLDPPKYRPVWLLGQAMYRL